MGNAFPEERIKTKPNLSVIALISFVASFLIARAFTSLNPATIWEISGFHIHHFWYGVVMIAIGGWIGISVENERLNRVAAILYGAGGGLIGDEVGLLLTLSAHGYWASFTYTILIIFIAFVSFIILFVRYNKVIRAELLGFSRSNIGLLFGVFLAVISIAFILETDNLVLLIICSILALLAFAIIFAYFAQQIKMRLLGKAFVCE